MNPNIGFMEQIIKYEARILSKNSVQMALVTRNGKSMSVPDMYIGIPSEFSDANSLHPNL